MSQVDKPFLIVTGLSGAGKTQVSKALEDIGFFCVDNLPAPLISRFADLTIQSEGNITKVCLVVDLRGESFFNSIDEALEYLQALGVGYKIVFLDATDEVLVRRFKEKRRTHPQSLDGSLLSGIHVEREKLDHLRQISDFVIDTSEYTPKDLKDDILLRWKQQGEDITVCLTSFGFKNGVPIDADIIMDVRFIKNPYYVPELRPLTGRDLRVQDYIFADPIANKFVGKFADMVLDLLPEYVKEGKSQLSIGIGCTGGQHRSIALTIRLQELIREAGYHTMATHRDH